MVVSEGAINNIMGGMENTAGVRLHSHRHKLKQRFDIIRKLGQGTYGKVQLAVNKETGQEVAIKTIKKAKIETEQDLIRIRREIQIMSSVQHPQIIHIYEVFENREKMVLVMEYAAGGELYDYLSERKVLSEEEARRVFRHVASATYYCHKHKICHRDLKLENILLDLEGNAKIADFGLSNVFDDKHRLDTFCGSPLYASPEIVKGVPYTGPEVDCWSLGVLLYTLVYGAMPFDGSNFKRLVKQITQGDYYEPKKPSSASDLIRQMLTVSASKRATIEDICSHWWVNEGYLESCLDVAEALANQTPVRLDLLLSLAPKHINSEHMLIQPEEDESMRSPPTSEATRPPPQLHLPPPPPEALPVIPTRSVSLGAISSVNHNEIDALLTKKLKEKKKEEDKKRKADQSGVIEKKKKRESTVEGTPKVSRKERKSESTSQEGDVSSSRRPLAGPEVESAERKKSSTGTKKKDQLTDGDSLECKKSVKKSEPAADGDISDVSEKSERKKSVKKRESSIGKDSSENDKVERKKSVKKRDSSLTRPTDDKERRKSTTKKKETVKDDSSVSANSKSVTETVINGEESSELEMGKPKVTAPLSTSEDQLPGLSLKPPLPKDQVLGRSSSSDAKTRKSNSGKNDMGSLPQNEQSEPMETEQLPPLSSSSPAGSPAKLSSSTKSMESSASNDATLKASDSSLSRESVSPMNLGTSPVSQTQSVKSKSPSPSQVKKVKSKSLVKTSSKTKVEDKSVEVPVMNGEAISPVSPSFAKVDETEKILQETADKIKQAEGLNIPVVKMDDTQGKDAANEESLKKEGETAGDQRRKEADSTPDSSKDASQSSSLLSTPARSRAGSESSNEARPSRTDSTKRQSKIFKAAAMWENQSSQQPPTGGDKAKKPVRPGGNAMSDLTKKFEDKPTADRKSKLVPSLKVSDAKRAFEAKSADKPSVIYRKKSLSDSLPPSPTTKESPQLPTTQSGPTILQDVLRESTPVTTTSPTKERSPSKDKSPAKDSVREKSPKKVKESGSTQVTKSKSPKMSVSEIKPQKNEGTVITPLPKKAEGKPDDAKKTPVTEKRPAGVDEKLVMPKTPTRTLEVSPRETVTSSEEEEAVVVGGLNLKLGGVGKISEVGTKQEVCKAESSDSSDSESEAEKMLKILSEKREKVEAARREKLRKVSEIKDREAKKDMPAIREEPQSKSPSKSPPTSPEKIEKPAAAAAAAVGAAAESSPEHKFATLPRGFKTKPAPGTVPPPPLGPPPMPDKVKKNNINQEIEGMMSAIKAVDRAITKEEQEIKILRDSLARNLPENRKEDKSKPQDSVATPRPERRPVVKEVQAIPPEQVLAPSIRDRPVTTSISESRARQGPADSQSSQEAERKKSQVEIVLNNKKPIGQEPDAANRRSSYAEIQLTSPTAKEALRPQEFKSEVQHSVEPPRSLGEAQLQRAKRERIIPIMLEDEEDDDDRTTSEGLSRSDRPNTTITTSSSLGSRVLPQPSQTLHSRASEPRSPIYRATPETIMKSRRERIIPIAVEGEGIVTPPPHVEEAAELGAARAHQAFTRTLASRPSPLNAGMMDGDGECGPLSPTGSLTGGAPLARRVHTDLGPTPLWQRRLSHTNSRGRGFHLDHSESFSSAGEEEEEDEDDGFQILTAESLFSTLLNRVRSLTRKMNADEMRSDRSRVPSHHQTPEPNTTPSSAGIGAGHSSSSGFWSSLYNSPRDSPARRISETMSRSSLGRDDETLGGLGSPLWTRSVSRDTSDADTLFSEASTPFSTLPRGWRSRWSGAEDGGESDNSEASGRSLGRRPQYSRVPSRELHNIPDEDIVPVSGYGYPGGGMSLPRPYPGSSSGSMPQRGAYDSQDRIASMYGTIRHPHRRPHSTVVPPPQGEGIGRDGGLCEQQIQRPVVSETSAHSGVTSPQQRMSQLSPSGQMMHSPDETAALKQSVQEQLQQLVRELEAGENPSPEVPLIPHQQPVSPQYENFPIPGVSRVIPVTQVQTSLSVSSPGPTPNFTMPKCFPPPQKSNLGPPPVQSSLSVEPGNAKGIHYDGQSSTSSNQSTQDFPVISNQRMTAPTSIPVCYSTTSSSVSPTLVPQNNVAFGDGINQGTFMRHTGSDQVGYNAILDISREDAGSPLGSDGIPESGVRRATAINEDWLRSGGPVVRSAETTALEAYRRSRGKEQQRGRSEEACHTTDSLARMEEANFGEISSPPPIYSNVTQDICQVTPSALGAPGGISSALPLPQQMVVSKSDSTSVSETNRNEMIANTIPHANARGGCTNNDQNNNGGLMISRSTSGIPLKSNSRSNITSRGSFSGLSTSISNLKVTSEAPQTKSYRRSKSKELTPAIEAASEKFSQLNSSTLKRISPFEAYRRTKSKELPIDAASKEAVNARLKSPPPGPERAKSPFERARSSIERQFERAKSPIAERAANRKSESLASSIHMPPTPILGRATSMGREKSDTEADHDKDMDNAKLAEKKDKEKSQVKKTSSCDPDKPKSMYKLLASRFNRSGSNVPEGSNRQPTDKRPEDDDVSEKEEKFKLKRPSRFMKHKAEKSSSKSSLCEGESSQDSSERIERKPSKKLTDALNKFLGRKDSKEEQKLAANSSPQLTDSSLLGDDQPRKPPRVKSKKFSKSQENLCRVEEGGEVVLGMPQTERAQSVVPQMKSPKLLQPDFTLESVTKSICDHLSQLENDISSRIGNMNMQNSDTTLVSSNGTQSLPTTSSVSSLNSYGLSPGLASRRNARPTNLDIAAAKIDNGSHSTSSIPRESAVISPSDLNIDSEEVKFAKIKGLGPPGNGHHLDDGNQTPTESGESTTSYGDEMRGQSENDDESVMDRITRKSYYTRFQEMKKKPKLRRANTKEDMDMQLAAAKARLMKEETQKTVRDSLSPLRFGGTSPATSPRASVTSPPSWDPIRKHSRKSLPPEDLTSTYLMGARRGASLQPDDPRHKRRHTSVQPDDRIAGRLPSLPPEDRAYNQRAPSLGRDPMTSHRTYSKSIPSNNSMSLPTSPLTTYESSNEDRVQDAVAAAMAAGAMAGEAAALAGDTIDGVREERRSASREPSISRLRSPEPVKLQTSSQEETRNMAREELSRRLTHLTRISGTSGLSAAARGGKIGSPEKSVIKPYRRTNTAGQLGDPTPGLVAPGAGMMERPVYRRTNTMDIPPADARARPGSEYRRLLQDPSRRYSAASYPAVQL